jgi:hypothetical protein
MFQLQEERNLIFLYDKATIVMKSMNFHSNLVDMDNILAKSDVIKQI